MIFRLSRAVMGGRATCGYRVLEVRRDEGAVMPGCPTSSAGDSTGFGIREGGEGEPADPHDGVISRCEVQRANIPRTLSDTLQDGPSMVSVLVRSKVRHIHSFTRQAPPPYFKPPNPTLVKPGPRTQVSRRCSYFHLGKYTISMAPTCRKRVKHPPTPPETVR